MTQAFDLAAHKGYQNWHRMYDQVIVDWLTEHPEATEEMFEQELQQMSSSPDMLQRFPHALEDLK